MTPVVLKLGGSLATSGRLRSTLAIVRRSCRPIVIVPGGGVFADAVRASQEALHFSDEAAHHMALLAMHQMARAMMALEERLVPAETLVAMARAWRQRRVPVWLPAKLCAGDRRIPRDWSITSDGLAARLAERLGSAELLIVKSCRVRRTASADALARRGIVDGVFPVIVKRAGLDWRVLGDGDTAALERALDALARPGSPQSSRNAHTRTQALAPGRRRGQVERSD